MKFIFIGYVLACSYIRALPQENHADSTIASLKEVRAQMLRSNLQLLANYYQIDIARAALVQARLWNNPYFVFNGDLYSNEANEYFHFRNQHLLQIEQTISIAGKHTNTVRLARIDIERAETQLQEVLRALLLETGNIYSNLASLQEKEKLYQQVLSNYDRLIEATRRQLTVGAISETEALRLESEYLAVKTEALSNYTEKEKVMSDLRILMALPEDSSIMVEQGLPLIAPALVIEELQNIALSARADLRLKKTDQRYLKQNLKLQKSIGVPDVKLAYQPRDRGSNYVRPYQGFNVEFSLPLFDRNQGEIKSAEFNIEKNTTELEQTEIRIKNEVIAAYRRYNGYLEGLNQYNENLLARLESLNQGANENFQRKNISLLQFIDYQRIFILTNIQLIELKQQFMNSINELNFTLGTTLIDY